MPLRIARLAKQTQTDDISMELYICKLAVKLEYARMCPSDSRQLAFASKDANA